jgi:hypothetical protein
MEFSDLPQSAQDRIAAAEIEAELILKRSKIPSQVARIRAKNPLAKPESWRDGSIQEQKRFEQSLFDAAALDSLHQGRIQAARHLLGAAAEELLVAGDLDIKQFDAKLESVGDWVCKKFRVKRAWGDIVKQGWRAARRKRPAGGFPKPDHAEATERGGNEPNAMDAGPAVNGTDRRPIVDAFILKCSGELSLKVNRKHIWRAAGHSTARQFQFWQACDPKATAQDDQNFRRILAMNPTEFEALLKKKGIILP